MIKDAADTNIYKIFQDNASQLVNTAKILNMHNAKELSSGEHMAQILEELRNHKFDSELKKAASKKYDIINKYNFKTQSSQLIKTHTNYNKNPQTKINFNLV